MSSFKLDIFEVMAAIDRRDMGFYSRLSDDQKKGFAPIVALRWASSIENDPRMAERYIWLINEANVNFWEIHQHPELQYKIMCSAGAGVRLRHGWIPQAKSAHVRKGKLFDFLSEAYPDANGPELDLLANKFSLEEFEDYVKSFALFPDEELEIINAHRSYHGKTPKRKTAKAGRGKGTKA